MGSGSKKLRRGIVALACVVVAAAVAGPAAAEGPPKPEPSPSRGAAPIRPEAPPSATPAAQTTQKTSGSYQGSGSSTNSGTPAQNYTPAVTPPPTSAPPQVGATKTPAHRTAKKDPPVRLPTQPVESIASTGGQILATSAHGLTKAPTSSESLLLLLVGLALVVLVVGETTFLRLAARGPAPQRAAEEQLPIRRVQLKR